MERPPTAAGDAVVGHPWVELRSLSKTFGAARVLHDVDFTVRSGEIHGLVGQNGSGKSTLIKVLSGVHAADPGSHVAVDGTSLSSPVRPEELRRHGVAFVHQDLGLVDTCSVVENIRLGQFGQHRVTRRIDWRAERRVAAETLARLHMRLDPDRLVSGLHAGERAVVAVARALQSIVPGGGCIVFDESTRALPRELLADFYAMVRRLASDGTAVIIVSHRLDEVLALTDRVTVLQDGEVVAGDRATAGLTEASLARLLLGRELELLEALPARPSSAADVTKRPVALEARGLRGGELRQLDLEVHAGEVVGITGASGSGQGDVPAVLSGARPLSSGVVRVGDVELRLPAGDPGRFIAAGVVLIPEERARDGIALELTAQENLTLPRVRARGRLRLRSGWQAEEFRRAADMLGIVPARGGLPGASFSGGNQQKLLLAKWLLHDPVVVVLHEPTQAVDVGARMDILRALRAAAARGVGVVVVSTEPQDLAAICDRVVVLREGEVAVELDADVTPHAITQAIYPDAAAPATSLAERTA